ncbi:MAG: urease accessory protein UreF [Azospirillum sp.]|nr:urease accessory protein UreF [Azospirillum sp.]
MAEPAPADPQPESRPAGTLYRLLAWLSPAYPTGGFSYSHGLEYAVEAALVHDRATLVGWVGQMITAGPGWIDAVLCAHAWRAVSANDDQALDDLADLAAAWRGSAETALESVQQGGAFLATTRAAWGDARLDAFVARRGGDAVALPIALGLAAAAHGIALDDAVLGCLQSFSASLVSAAVRLVPLGQTDGQKAIASLATLVAATAVRATERRLDDLGSASPMVDWSCLAHETQYTRLFRS